MGRGCKVVRQAREVKLCWWSSEPLCPVKTVCVGCGDGG